VTTACPARRAGGVRGLGVRVARRLVGGSLLKATIRNDGSAFAYEEGTAVTLHLPPEAVRVLTPEL